MKNRERIKKVFNHEEPDKVLLNIGVARGCGITIPAYKNLLTYPGLSYENIKSSQLTTQLTEVDKEVFNMLGIVFLSIRLNSICKTLIKKEKDHHWFINEWQRRWIKPKDTGYYYDIISFFLAEVPLNECQWPDPSNTARSRGESENRLNTTGKTIMYTSIPLWHGKWLFADGCTEKRLDFY